MDRTQQPADLTGHIDIEEHPSFRGGHGDIRKGIWDNGQRQQAVGILSAIFISSTELSIDCGEVASTTPIWRS